MSESLVTRTREIRELFAYDRWAFSESAETLDQ